MADSKPTPRSSTASPTEDLARQLKALQEQVATLTAWKTSKETQQLAYPLDFISQQIVGGNLQTPGPSSFLMGGVRGFGIFYGAGSPNAVVKAAKGSLFLNYTGSNTATRAYINTDGDTAWTAVTTAA